MALDIQKLRGIWADRLGFVPAAVATFDHITAGLPSRLLVGQLRLAQFCQTHKLNSWHVLNVVVDTVLPRREVPCGVSAELGFLPNQKTIWVEDPSVFYFKNRFRPNFEEVREELFEAVQKSLNGQPVQDSIAHMQRAVGNFGVLELLWGKVRTCEEVMIARKQLFEALGCKIITKQRLLSELLSTVAEVLREVERQGFPMRECPGTGEVGFVRLVNENGTEGEIVREWHPSLLDMVGKQGENGDPQPEALPTAPMMVLATSLLFPHFGNDYGLVDNISRWLNLDPDIHAADVPDGENSWPVVEIINSRNGQRLLSLFLDLGWYENYPQLLKMSLLEGRTLGPLELREWGRPRL